MTCSSEFWDALAPHHSALENSYLQVSKPNYFVICFAGAFKAEFPDHDGGRVFLNQLDVAGQLAGRDPLNQALYLWSKSMLLNYVLTILGDRMEMAHSIKGRVPFLDHHVIECLRQVPVSLKIRGTTEKHILREATRSVITDAVYRREKHPFLSPPVTTLPGGRFHEMLQDTLRGPVLRALPFYDQKKVVTLLDGLTGMSDQDRTVWDQVVMPVLSACVLQERFKL